MSEWKTIDSAPKEEVAILVAYDSGYIELIEDSSEFDWKPYRGRRPLCSSPTHWMPLPEPPADNDAQVAGGIGIK